MVTQMGQGSSFSESAETLKSGYLSTLCATWLVWIPLQFLNFSVVPPCYRVLVLNTGCLVYMCQLDLISEYYRHTLEAKKEKLRAKGKELKKKLRSKKEKIKAKLKDLTRTDR